MRNIFGKCWNYSIQIVWATLLLHLLCMSQYWRLLDCDKYSIWCREVFINQCPINQSSPNQILELVFRHAGGIVCTLCRAGLETSEIKMWASLKLPTPSGYLGMNALCSVCCYIVRFPNCHECPVASGLGNLNSYIDLALEFCDNKRHSYLCTIAFWEGAQLSGAQFADLHEKQEEYGGVRHVKS